MIFRALQKNIICYFRVREKTKNESQRIEKKWKKAKMKLEKVENEKVQNETSKRVEIEGRK